MWGDESLEPQCKNPLFFNSQPIWLLSRFLTVVKLLQTLSIVFRTLPNLQLKDVAVIVKSDNDLLIRKFIQTLEFIRLNRYLLEAFLSSSPFFSNERNILSPNVVFFIPFDWPS